jgi:5-methylcytosine-specific restriction protein B
MELMPDYELPQIDRKIGKINLAKLLEELNKKIRNQNLRDKQIGHSYFMNITNISELQRVFKYEIIPLLQDYFYDDYALLEKILGKKIISVKNMSINHKFVDSIGFEDELDKISRNKLDDENVNSDEEPVKNDND